LDELKDLMDALWCLMSKDEMPMPGRNGKEFLRIGDEPAGGNLEMEHEKKTQTHATFLKLREPAHPRGMEPTRLTKNASDAKQWIKRIG
jgi:hypothetical protein